MKWNKRMDEEGVSPVIAIILMVAITVVLAGVLYVWVTSLADTGSTVENRNYNAEILVDSGGSAVVAIKLVSGSEVSWAEMTVRCNGSEVSPTTESTSVGETAQFTYTGGAIEIGEEYTVIIVDKSGDASAIVFDKDVRAKSA